jgi:uncharacterized membrane protein
MKTKALGKKPSPLKLTLIMMGLISLLGLGIDSGCTYLERHSAQRAADAAAQAGALAIARGQDFTFAAQAQAARYGYANDGVNDSVLVNNPPGIGCNGKSDSYAGDIDFVQVVIHSDFHLYFAQMVGIQEAHTCVEAVKHIAPSAFSMLE